MAGFPLMAIGAGIGQAAKAWQEQQAAQERTMMLRLQLQRFQQEQEDRASKQAGAEAQMGSPPLGAGGPPLSGGMPSSASLPPMGPQGVAPNMGQNFALPSAPPLRSPLPSGHGGAMQSAGDSWLNQNAPFPTLGNDLTAGPWQATMTPTPDATPYAGPGSSGPTTPMPAAGIPPPRSGQNAPQVAQAQPALQGAQPAPTGALSAGAAGAPPDLQKMLDAVPKPDMRSRINEQQIKEGVRQRYPTLRATEQVTFVDKELARQKAIEDERAKLQMKDYDTRLQAALETWKEQNTRAGRALEGGDLIIVDGNLYRQKGGSAAPVTAGGQPVTGATRLPTPSETETASKNIEVRGPDGKTIFSGAAHKAPGAKPGESSWISDGNQQRIAAPEGSEIIVKGEGGEGKQAAAAIIRLTSAANQAKKQIPNIARASAGTTGSWFQGIQAETGKDLSEGVRRSLANAITPREEQVMAVLGRGIGRTLASLETAGAATGLVALQQSMQGMLPAKNDDRMTALLKIADMAQIAEQAIESASAAQATGSEQKILLRSVQEEIRKAVPYTVADVLELVNKPGKDTYQSFAAKLGLGKKGAAAGRPGAAASPAGGTPLPGGGATAPIPAAPTTYRVGETIEVGGKRYRVTGIDPAKPDDPQIEEVK